MRANPQPAYPPSFSRLLAYILAQLGFELRKEGRWFRRAPLLLLTWFLASNTLVWALAAYSSLGWHWNPWSSFWAALTLFVCKDFLESHEVRFIPRKQTGRRRLRRPSLPLQPRPLTALDEPIHHSYPFPSLLLKL